MLTVKRKSVSSRQTRTRFFEVPSLDVVCLRPTVGGATSQPLALFRVYFDFYHFNNNVMKLWTLEFQTTRALHPFKPICTVQVFFIVFYQRKTCFNRTILIYFSHCFIMYNNLSSVRV